MQPKLSIIIPVYNAEDFIKKTIDRLIAWKYKQVYPVEIIVVNDGSNDNTLQILESFSNNFINTISYANNIGKGYALRTGMNKAKGLYKIFTDADIPYGVEVFNQMLNKLENENCDICIGNRLDDESFYHVQSGFWRKLSSKIFTIYINKLVISNAGDTQCGLKGFNEIAAKKLFSKARINGFAFDVETIYLSYKYNFNISKIPVKFEGNTISTINLLSSSIRMFFDVLSLPLNYYILKKY